MREPLVLHTKVENNRVSMPLDEFEELLAATWSFEFTCPDCGGHGHESGVSVKSLIEVEVIAI